MDFLDALRGAHCPVLSGALRAPVGKVVRAEHAAQVEKSRGAQE
jgi:hypothetical protein